MPGVTVQLVCFDLDGTVSLGHGWERIARRQGRLAEFQEAQERFRAGRSGEDTHLATLLNLAEGMSLTDLQEVLSGAPHLRHLSELVRELHRRGARVVLLTHNPEYVCRWYAERFGFDAWAGTRQRVGRSGKILHVGRRRVDKREGLRLLLEATGATPAATVHIGDGAADATVFPYVGTGISLNSVVRRVREEADVSLETRDALDLLPYLSRTRRSRPRRLPRPGAGRGSFHLGRSP